MPRWTELRRALARAVTTGGTHGHVTEAVTVPLAVRGRTTDGADLRLLVDVTLAPDAPAAGPDLERIAQALVPPAVRRWVGQHELDRLQAALPTARAGLEASVQPEIEALGARLLRLDVVAVEHLLTSPSAEPDHGDAE
ncbi:hypothetical protein ASE01_05040 [Nocardioides sp. Root190]|uniref:hypothetical protein n=1 Tax=Nocardioides sp. Root190 TaxID=1736488 RepID=UPI0006FFCE47|nr:hypothetical protein [Nocardioides sp. Root190]KRB78618.1 hypothetical protein ASE01_05040 [Nocardioides sp. Root190]